MARSLNSEEAAIFNENQSATDQFSAFMRDFAEGLSKHQDEEPELALDPGFWLRDRFRGS